MLPFQLSLLFVSAVIAILFGLRYLMARKFTTYVKVVGKPWSQLEVRVQAIILGMLRIIGGGFITYGLALLWILVPLNEKQWWAPWAVLTMTVATLAPVLHVMLWLRRLEPSARTPIVPAIVVLVLALLGAGSALIH